MDLQFERIQSGSHRHLHDLLGLYLESFPNEERRTTSDLLRMLNVQEMCFNAVLVEEVVVGFIVYWKFSQFRYIEHLAIFPAQRRKGYGEAILKQMQNEGKPILLEVEIPYDSTSTQRVGFYNRAGFNALPVYYHQPPYRKGESLVPMLLFSDRTDWDEELLKVSMEQFQEKVYYRYSRS